MSSVNSVLERLQQHLFIELRKNMEAHKTLPDGQFRIARPIPKDLMSAIRSQIGKEKAAENALVDPNVKKLYEFKDGEFRQTGVIVDARQVGRPESPIRKRAHGLVQEALTLAESGTVDLAINKLRKARETDPE